MPPQSAPSPTGQFDFILKNESKKSGGFPRLPKPILFGLIVVVLFLIIIILGSGLKTSGGSDKLYAPIAEANQIVSVSNDVIGQTKNPDVLNLATTTAESLSSQTKQLTALVKNAKSKSVTAKLSAKPNATIDTQLKTALANNTYDTTYLSYLKSSLNGYSNDLVTAYSSASSNSKATIKAAYDSTAVLLTSPQLK